MIIHSILDTDLYKLTMQNAVMKLYPRAKVRYQFINRGDTYFPEKMIGELKDEIFNMERLYLAWDEEEFLKEKAYFFDPVYIDFLKGYRYNSDEVTVSWKDGKLNIDIEGYWFHTIFWEVPLMAIISELYFKHTYETKNSWNIIDERNERKAANFDNLGVKVADFGTRRRYSYKSQDHLVKEFKDWDFFVGTSNVHFAHKYNLTPIGTQAHEWFMFHAAKYGFHQANSVSLGRWIDVYNGNLGIALTDTFTTKNFFESFDTLYAKLFDGVRHDSGDPIVFGQITIEHYDKLGIDPNTKTIVFSDGLTPKEVARIYNMFRGRIKLSFGIGTNLTNDMDDVRALNMVIKMVAAKPANKDWISTIKLSDDVGKNTGDKKMINLAKQILGV